VAEVWMNAASPVYFGFGEALQPSLHRYEEHVTSPQVEDGFTKQPTFFHSALKNLANCGHFKRFFGAQSANVPHT